MKTDLFQACGWTVTHTQVEKPPSVGSTSNAKNRTDGQRGVGWPRKGMSGVTRGPGQSQEAASGNCPPRDSAYSS